MHNNMHFMHYIPWHTITQHDITFSAQTRLKIRQPNSIPDDLYNHMPILCFFRPSYRSMTGPDEEAEEDPRPKKMPRSRASSASAACEEVGKKEGVVLKQEGFQSSVSACDGVDKKEEAVAVVVVAKQEETKEFKADGPQELEVPCEVPEWALPLSQEMQEEVDALERLERDQSQQQRDNAEPKGN